MTSVNVGAQASSNTERQVQFAIGTKEEDGNGLQQAPSIIQKTGSLHRSKFFHKDILIDPRTQAVYQRKYKDPEDDLAEEHKYSGGNEKDEKKDDGQLSVHTHFVYVLGTQIYTHTHSHTHNTHAHTASENVIWGRPYAGPAADAVVRIYSSRAS